MFDKINEPQALWYQIQMSLDVKDQYELLRDIAEHNAMFMNPEGVQQIRDARENTFETPDEEFDELLESTFGRKVSRKDNKEKVDIVEVLRQDALTSKYSPVVDLELDDISFTPFK
jgi:hypothetical protein